MLGHLMKIWFKNINIIYLERKRTCDLRVLKSTQKQAGGRGPEWGAVYSCYVLDPLYAFSFNLRDNFVRKG